jgi:TatD DNase family protein
VARAALDLGFYISFSGILTFRNAADLREVARSCRWTAADRNRQPLPGPGSAPRQDQHPSYVPHVAAAQIAELKGAEAVGELTSRNFDLLFDQVTA